MIAVRMNQKTPESVKGMCFRKAHQFERNCTTLFPSHAPKKLRVESLPTFCLSGAD